jgi:hypothetical protein
MPSSASSQALASTTAPSGGYRFAKHDPVDVGDKPHQRVTPSFDWRQAQILAIETK